MERHLRANYSIVCALFTPVSVEILGITSYWAPCQIECIFPALDLRWSLFLDWIPLHADVNNMTSVCISGTWLVKTLIKCDFSPWCVVSKLASNRMLRVLYDETEMFGLHKLSKITDFWISVACSNLLIDVDLFYLLVVTFCSQSPV